MKKKKFIFCALAALVCFTFSGCAKVYELTDADEDMIAVYCAKTVSKFNTIKAQGYTNLIGADLKEIYALSEGSEDASEIVEEEAVSEVVTDPEATEAVAMDETGTVDNTDVSDSELQISDASPLSEALSIEGLTFDYKSVAVMDYYSIGGYANINPSRGKQFLVVTYNVINTTDQDVAVDIPSTGYKFKATVGGVSNTTDGTMVPTDLSVYKGAVPAGHAQVHIVSWKTWFL